MHPRLIKSIVLLNELQAKVAQLVEQIPVVKAAGSRPVFSPETDSLGLFFKPKCPAGIRHAGLKNPGFADVAGFKSRLIGPVLSSKFDKTGFFILPHLIIAKLAMTEFTFG